MANGLKEIIAQAESEAPLLKGRADFEAFKAKLVGPNGSLTQVMKSIGKLPPAERPAMGQLINQAKKELEAIFASTLSRIETQEMEGFLGQPIDPTLPSPDGWVGSRHPLAQVAQRMASIFARLGFSLNEGPEVDTEWFCFDALNVPDSHPARDAQDTFFIKKEVGMGDIEKRGSERYLLRSHTTTVQIRAMLEKKPPMRGLSIGRVFRRDTTDATHSANFHQMDGFCVDRNVTIKDLKAALDFFICELFGSGVKTRFRPSFFPFTEPSFEMDIQVPNLGKLSDKWIEAWGCGMIDPEVFKSVGYDPQHWSGYAFGMGIERLAMLLYGIDDVRLFYQNDLRFLQQFA
ncbi:MAG: phenylalanine--tRNA ligase subunit alpha [Verrucomicrobia bacterium GWC2_42_7]|nr:MAG: phenylalanine--tRNA ligase subunit alpha [Verrucomicrobia bacterium GWC2_42_7]